MSYKNLVVALVVAVVMMFSGVALAGDYAIAINGGMTNPHSECDGDSCLDQGLAFSVELLRDLYRIRLHERADILLEGSLAGWYMSYSESDRETSSSPRTNTHGVDDYLGTAMLKAGVEIYDRVTPYGIAGIGTSVGDPSLFTAVGVGVRVRVYKNISIQGENMAIRSKCTWHRTATVGLRYDF